MGRGKNSVWESRPSTLKLNIVVEESEFVLLPGDGH